MRTVLAVAAAAACLLAPPAQGQTVTIYGLLDAGVEYINHVGADRSSLTRMPNLTGSLPSRLGFRGTEDLGGGLKALFALEQGLAIDSGSLGQGGRAFGRTALVGLSGPWGAFTLGRQYTMLYWAVFDADTMGPNVYGLGSLDSYLAGPRADNSMAFRGTYGGLTVGAGYSAGRDLAAPASCAGESATDSTACREMSAMLKYEAGGWGVAAGVDRLYGGAGGGAGLNSSALTDQRVTVNAYARLGAFRFGGGLMRRTNEASPAPKSDLWFLGVVYSLSPQLALDVAAYKLDSRDTPNDALMLAARATYSLSKRTAVYANLGRISNDGTLALSVSGGSASGAAPTAGATQSGLMMGLRHTF